ncbi:hypothetical protein O1L60_23895 [Streptomyces diastatochromogenes]|nr:hypothetical protein [Streptomyces diastatochromogenes]
MVASGWLRQNPPEPPSPVPAFSATAPTSGTVQSASTSSAAHNRPRTRQVLGSPARPHGCTAYWPRPSVRCSACAAIPSRRRRTTSVPRSVAASRAAARRRHTRVALGLSRRAQCPRKSATPAPRAAPRAPRASPGRTRRGRRGRGGEQARRCRRLAAQQDVHPVPYRGEPGVLAAPVRAQRLGRPAQCPDPGPVELGACSAADRAIGTRVVKESRSS